MKLHFVVLFVPDKPQLNNKNCIILGNPCQFFFILVGLIREVIEKINIEAFFKGDSMSIFYL